MDLITSRQNSKIKQVRALRQRKQRQAQNLFVVEGIRHVGEAVESGVRIEYLLYAPDLLVSGYAQSLVETCQNSGVDAFACSSEVFKNAADKENPQGLLAVVHTHLNTLSALSPANFSFGAAITSPQDPGNLGTILRTLDAVGADGLILLDGGVDPFHPSAVRSSMGTFFTLLMVSTEFASFQQWSRQHKYQIYGSSAHGEQDYRDTTYQSPAILLLGSEREGLTDVQAAACKTIVKLPMRGQASSLNLSVASGVLLYEMMHQLQS
jgi:TrmH family RNA methyltransferase